MFPHTVRHPIKRTAEVVDRRVFHSRKFMLTRMIRTRLSSDPTAGSAATRRRRVRRARRGCFRLPVAFPPSVCGAQKPALLPPPCPLFALPVRGGRAALPLFGLPFYRFTARLCFLQRHRPFDQEPFRSGAARKGFFLSASLFRSANRKRRQDRLCISLMSR